MKRSIVFIIIFYSSITVSAQDGSIDLSYGDNGTSIIDIANKEDNLYKAIEDLNNRIVIVGATYDFSIPSIETFVMRVLEDGNLDTSFGSGGTVLLPYTEVEFEDVRVQNDNKILAIDNSQLTIYRFTENGLLDGGFGANGILQGMNTDEQGFVSTIDDQDRIVAIGLTMIDGINNFFIRRFLENGSIDLSFGNNGTKLFSSQLTESIEKFDAKILQNGQLLVVIHQEMDPVNRAMRFLESGEIDLSFGINGLVDIPISNDFDCICYPEINEHILLSCTYYDFNFITLSRQTMKLDWSGNLDTSFGNNGYLDNFSISLIQDNQRILVNNSEIDFEGGIYLSFYRYFNGGYIDESFQLESNFQETGNDDVLLLNSGKLLITGNTMWYSGEADVYLIRLNNNPLSTPEFDVRKAIVFPNPSGASFNIELSNYNTYPIKYSILDSSGRKLHFGEFNSSRAELDLQSLGQGLYHLKIGSNSVPIIKE